MLQPDLSNITVADDVGGIVVVVDDIRTSVTRQVMVLVMVHNWVPLS